MSEKAIPFGGQALIEGVLMRGPRSIAMAVRRPDGRIEIRSETIDSAYTSLRKVPLVRGVVTLGETFAYGIKALYWSSRVSTGQEHERITRAEMAISGATLALAASIFIAGPVLLTQWIGRAWGGGWTEVAAEGALRIGLLIGYIWFIGRLPEVQRVFAYHGAEHRTIHAYEHGQPLTSESIHSFENAHPRCGTAFLLTVGVLSLVAFIALGTPPLWERLLERAILTPVIAAFAYEVLRASQAYEDHPLAQILRAPNLWLQKMTTRDPDDAQIEVAVAALNAVIAIENTLPEAGLTPAPVSVDVDNG